MFIDVSVTARLICIEGENRTPILMIVEIGFIMNHQRITLREIKHGTGSIKIHQWWCLLAEALREIKTRNRIHQNPSMVVFAC
jgi:hypothetical protein